MQFKKKGILVIEILENYRYFVKYYVSQKIKKWYFYQSVDENKIKF